MDGLYFPREISQSNQFLKVVATMTIGKYIPSNPSNGHCSHYLGQRVRIGQIHEENTIHPSTPMDSL